MIRTVLIVEIKLVDIWGSAAAYDRLMEQISRQADAAFNDKARERVFWIATIGPHWKFGHKDDNGQNPISIGGWQHTIHGAASYRKLMQLKAHVAQL
jgi:hypothetical protein